MGCGLATAPVTSRTLPLRLPAAHSTSVLWRRCPTTRSFPASSSWTGVGKKVANCVCLFGYGRTAMAPIDVWIQRLIDEESAARDPFPSYDQQAGIVQQYLFYYKRSTSRSVAHKK